MRKYLLAAAAALITLPVSVSAQQAAECVVPSDGWSSNPKATATKNLNPTSAHDFAIRFSAYAVSEMGRGDGFKIHPDCRNAFIFELVQRNQWTVSETPDGEKLITDRWETVGDVIYFPVAMALVPIQSTATPAPAPAAQSAEEAGAKAAETAARADAAEARLEKLREGDRELAKREQETPETQRQPIQAERKALQQAIERAEQFARSAKQAADAAAASATAAQQSASAAAGSATQAKGWAEAAEKSATNAANSEESAAASATSAQASADNAANAQKSAAASAQEAKDLASEIWDWIYGNLAVSILALLLTIFALRKIKDLANRIGTIERNYVSDESLKKKLDAVEGDLDREIRITRAQAGFQEIEFNDRDLRSVLDLEPGSDKEPELHFKKGDQEYVMRVIRLPDGRFIAKGHPDVVFLDPREIAHGRVRGNKLAEFKVKDSSETKS